MTHKEISQSLFLRQNKSQNKLNQPKIKVSQILEDFQKLLSPYQNWLRPEDLELFLQRAELNLYEMLKITLPSERAQEVSLHFITELPKVGELLDKDARAIFEGDPAAQSIDEVISCYPGFFAITVHRISHVLYLQKVPIIARLFSEYAHQITGIDIHPGALIGEYFCIDHGTGIVIGETTIIGNRVKIYQGVTLGALSVSKDLSQTKRHPTIEDNCVIYSNATILGGQTTIGHHSIVGGNVWLTQSVPPHSLVQHKGDIHIELQKQSSSQS